MKKNLIFVLGIFASVLLFSLTVFGGFDDVTEGKWYSEGVDFCAANEYMSGTSEYIFDRNAELTRAMFMTILAKVDGADLTEFEGKSSFEDVKTDGWYTAAIEWGYQNELASGIADGIFGYKNPVTREQMALFFYSYAEYLNASVAAEAPLPDIPDEYTPEASEETEDIREPVIDTAVRADLSVFSDSGRVHSWAKDSMEWAVGCGLLSGTGEDLLDPRGNCTRAQTAVIIRSFVLNLLVDCEHDWEEPNCTSRGQCNLCELYNRQALGHSVGDRICTEEAVCLVCGEIVEGTAHRYAPATCVAPKTCTVCGHTDGDPIAHTVPNGYCTRCKAENFTDPHQRLLYFLRKDGTRKGNICYFENPYVTTPSEMKQQKYVVYAVDNNDSVFMQFSYVNESGSTHIIELELEDYDHPFHYYVEFWIRSDGFPTTCKAGTVNVKYLDSWGQCTVDDDGFGRADYHVYNGNIPRMFFHCSRLMQVYAGVNLNQYGFNMAEITKDMK